METVYSRYLFSVSRRPSMDVVGRDLRHRRWARQEKTVILNPGEVAVPRPVEGLLGSCSLFLGVPVTG